MYTPITADDVIDASVALDKYIANMRTIRDAYAAVYRSVEEAIANVDMSAFDLARKTCSRVMKQHQLCFDEAGTWFNRYLAAQPGSAQHGFSTALTDAADEDIDFASEDMTEDGADTEDYSSLASDDAEPDMDVGRQILAMHTVTQAEADSGADVSEESCIHVGPSNPGNLLLCYFPDDGEPLGAAIDVRMRCHATKGGAEALSVLVSNEARLVTVCTWDGQLFVRGLLHLLAQQGVKVSAGDKLVLSVPDSSVFDGGAARPPIVAVHVLKSTAWHDGDSCDDDAPSMCSTSSKRRRMF